MSILGIGLMVIGGLIFFIGTIMFLIQAFKESIIWGLACILLPIVGLVFLIMFWKDAKRSFCVKCLGALVGVAGLMLFLFGMNGKIH